MTNNPHLGLTFGKRLHITGYNTLVMLDTSYKEIISDTRKHRAFEYLAGNSLTTNQIANRLGYSDPSNFSKAFKHWTGLAPSDFRDASLSMAYSNGSIDDRR